MICLSVKGESMKKFILMVLMGGFLSSCGGSLYNRDPVGIGYDNAEMKLSPCACILVPQNHDVTPA